MKISSKLQLAVLAIFILIAASIVILTSRSASNTTSSRTTSSFAASNIPAKCNCTNPDNCYPDGCSGKPKTENNTFDSDRYDRVCKNINFGWPPDIEVQKYFCSIRQPDSCFDVYRYKDDRLSCFMERWFCHPSLCEGASGNGDCGKYWRLPDGWTSYGCVKGPDNNNLTPIWGNLPPNLPGGQQPTNPPQPTNTPVVLTNTPFPPTHTPAPNAPTNTPYPTAAPTNPSPTQQTFLPPITNNAPSSIPSGEQPIGIVPDNNQITPTTPPFKPGINILPNKQQIVHNLENTTSKPLAVVNTSYYTVILADQKLESSVNDWIFRLRIALLKAFGV